MTVRAESVSTRGIWALLLALILALRLLSSTGFMPAIANGHVAIIACPDAGGSAPLAIGDLHHHHHHDGHANHQHSLCPYAAASWLSFVGGDFTPLLILVFAAFAVATLAASPAPVIARRHMRPPLRGPPLPA